MELNACKDGEDVPLPHLPNIIPHNIDDNVVFIYKMSTCASEINYALTLCSELVLHLYPYVHKEDEYIHLPLVGRDETCTERMLLTNAALMEYLGLLTKAEKGLYKLGPKAKKRTFLCIVMLSWLISTTDSMT